MKKQSWVRPDESVPEPPSGENRSAVLVSLHFLLAALRRRRTTCVVVAIAGVLVAAGLMLIVPPPHMTKTTLIVGHDPQLDPTRAMATDVALLETRTVAALTIAELGLDMTPEDFHKTVKVVPVGTELLTIQLEAPSDEESVRRLTVLSSTYLAFRAEQLTLQTDSTVNGLQEQIDRLNSQVRTLSRKIQQLSSSSADSSEVGDAISQRASAQNRIDNLTQSMQDAKLRTSTIVSSSQVVDPAAPEPGLALRSLLLGLLSGLIGGIALGCGPVLISAVVSDRIRRRSDVAEALGVPVKVSVGKLAPPEGGWRLPAPRRSEVERQRVVDRKRLAQAISTQFGGTSPRSAGVACVDNASEVGLALISATAQLADRGLATVVIDLSAAGVVDPHLVRPMRSSPGPTTILRPTGMPEFATTPDDLVVIDGNDREGVARSLENADAILVVAELDPSVTVDHLKAWTDRTLIVVTAGRSSAERLRTVADLLRSSALDISEAALVGADPTDDSSGSVGVTPPALPVTRAEEQSRPAEDARAEAR